MRLPRLSAALSVLGFPVTFSLIACSSSGTSGSDGEKQDDEDVRLEELAGEDLDQVLGAGVVEFVAHDVIDTSTDTENGYGQQVKLLCTQTGGHIAPMECYIAVLSLGEADGANRMFRVGGNLQSDPTDVSIAISGATAKVSWSGSAAVFTDDLDFEDRKFSATVGLSGDASAPDVKVDLACAKLAGGACSSSPGVTPVSLDENQMWQYASVEFVKYAVIETSTDDKPDGYHQEIKLVCNQYGSHTQPISCMVGVLPLSEIGGTYKMFRVNEHITHAPHAADIKLDGTKAKVSWAGYILDWDAEEVSTLEIGYGVDIELSGNTEEPEVKTTFTRTAK